jgi:hypothetical protein
VSFTLTFPERNPLGERTERHETDPEFSACGNDVSLEHALHHRILTLNRRQWRDGVRAADLLLRRLRLAPAQNLALRDQLAHHGRNLLDGDGVRHPVLIIQLYVIRPQPRQRPIEVGPNPAAQLRARKRACHMELRGDDDLIADRRQRPADQPLILACGVTLSSVVKGAAQIEGLAHQIDRLVFVRRRPVSVTEPHRAQTDSRDFQIASSESTFLHRYLPSLLRSPDIARRTQPLKSAANSLFAAAFRVNERLISGWIAIPQGRYPPTCEMRG